MTDIEITEEEAELVMSARQHDDPVVLPEADADRLAANEALLDDAEALESPTLVEKSEYETSQERIKKVESLIADALQGRTGLSDAAIEAMPFEAMVAEFETDDGELEAEALVQTPETGDPDDQDLDDSEVEALLDALDAGDRDEAIDVLETQYEQYEAAGWESNAEEAKQRLETLGVEV